jgi:hypothetical protein
MCGFLSGLSMIIGWTKIRKSSETFLVDYDETNADGYKNVFMSPHRNARSIIM